MFVFAVRACVRDATRDQGVSRHVFVFLLLLLSSSLSPARPASRAFFDLKNTETIIKQRLSAHF